MTMLTLDMGETPTGNSPPTNATTTGEPPDPKLGNAPDFVAEIIRFYADGRGTGKARLARLRRSAGDSLAEARDIAWFYQFVNRFAHRGDEDILFLVATLLAFDRPALEGKRRFKGSFGKTLAILKNQPGANAESVERRFRILLDARLDSAQGEGDMPFRLRQMVKLILSKDAPIDWAQLLHDLRLWNQPGKYRQKQWAKDFYGGAPENKDDATTTNADTAHDAAGE